MFRRSRVISRTTGMVPVVFLVMLALAASTAADTPFYAAAEAASPDAPPPILMNYQGRLLDPATGEPKPDQVYNTTFELYTVEAGGVPIWSESQPIVTNKGLFSVVLGIRNPIDPGIVDGSPRWLGVFIDPDGALLPRIRVAHTPYAIWSNRSGFAAQAEWAGVAELAVNSEHLGGNPPLFYRDAGNLTAGTLPYERFSAYGDLEIDGRIGAGSGMVAPGLHVHKGADIVDGSIGTVDLADNSVTTAKINPVGGSTNHVLYHTGSAAAWGYAPGADIAFTVLPVNCTSVASFGTTYVKIADIGTVRKLDATSRLDITFNGRIYVKSIIGTGALFELRVDNLATTNGRARANLKAAEVGTDGLPVSIIGIFTGFGAGNHTVSLWVAASSGSGTVGGMDPGCWSSDHVVVKEIK